MSAATSSRFPSSSVPHSYYGSLEHHGRRGGEHEELIRRAQPAERIITRRCSTPPLLILSLLFLLVLISAFLVHHTLFPRGVSNHHTSSGSFSSDFFPSPSFRRREGVDVDEFGQIKARVLELEKRVWVLEGRESHLGGNEERERKRCW